jgi:hypothetical protein
MKLGMTKLTRMDYKSKENLLKELKPEIIVDKILKYKINWIQHVDRIERDELPNALKAKLKVN